MTRAARLVLASASALFLELLFLRWIGGEAPSLAYFKNFPLLAAFLGMGVGARLARGRDLAVLAPCTLGPLGVALACAGPLGLDLAEIVLPDPNLDVWKAAGKGSVAFTAGAALVLLSLMAAGFVALGQRVGRLLDEAGARLPAYGLDLLGSLGGALAALATCALRVPPARAFPIGLLAAALSSEPATRRRPLALAAAAGALALGADVALARDDVLWSPYYRIHLEPHVVSGVLLGTRLSVNRDVHQVALDLSDEALAAHPSVVLPRRTPYDLPWDALGVDGRGARVLVAGAGTGNDVACALRRGATSVVAVELDPAIAELGRERHPERPYARGEVRVVADDARAAFRGLRGEGFDVLLYGLLDAHASLAAFGTVRHEDFVYTVEGVRAGLATLGPRGVACVTFFEHERRWLGSRIAAVVARAQGAPPVVARLPRGGHVFILFGPGMDRDVVRSRLEDQGLRDEAEERLAGARPTTDDWPFLYLSPAGAPVVYLSALAGLVLVAVLGILLAGRLDRGGTGGSARPLEMALLGAAFLLLETKGITDLARLLGATWLVSGLAISGVLLVLLLANAAAAHVPARAAPWAGVAAALALVLPRAVGVDLDPLPPVARALGGIALVALPVGLGGIAFSRAFARVEAGAGGRALAANLAGAALGGGLEALALVLGLSSLAWVAAGIYLVWAVVHGLGGRPRLPARSAVRAPC